MRAMTYTSLAASTAIGAIVVSLLIGVWGRTAIPASAQPATFCPDPPPGMDVLNGPTLRESGGQLDYTCSYAAPVVAGQARAAIYVTGYFYMDPPTFNTSNRYCEGDPVRRTGAPGASEISGSYRSLDVVATVTYRTSNGASGDDAAAAAQAVFAHLEPLASDCPGSGNTGQQSSPPPAATSTPNTAAPQSGVIERDGKLFLMSPPDGPLIISRSDLPEWARDQLVTVGASIVSVGFPDHVVTGDPGVLLDGRPVARLDDKTAHGGQILDGSETIFINGVPAAFRGGFAVSPLVTGVVPHVGGPINPDCNLKEAIEDSNEALRDCLAEYDMVIQFLEQAAARGATVLEVDSDGFEIGDGLIVGSDPENSEAARVAGRGSIILDRPLSRGYPAGTAITRVPDEYAELIPPSTGGGVATDAPPGAAASSGGNSTTEANARSVGTIAAIFLALLGGAAAFFVYRRAPR